MGQKSKKRKTQSNPPPPLPPPPPPQQQPQPVDRLSSLPDAILVDILSLLPTQYAVSTSVLSSRWRLLWPHLTALHLDSRQFPKQTPDFDYFETAVDQLLTKLTPPFLRAFSIRAPYPHPHHLEPWLRLLCNRRLQIIEINSEFPSPDHQHRLTSLFTLPRCIFRSQSLVCLTLCEYLDYDLPHGSDIVFKLPHLRKLDLAFRVSRFEFVAKLVRSCPLLEDLTLTCPKGSNDNDASGVIIDISCTSLKRLQLNLFAPIKNAKLVIDAPKLDRFAMIGSASTCSFTRKPTALHAAMIITSSLALVLSLYPVILNIRVLEIPAVFVDLFQSLKDDNGNSLFFPNLTNLKLILGTRADAAFPLVSSSPNLLSRIKMIKVILYNVKDGRKLVDYLFNNAPGLERLVFVVIRHPSQSENKLAYMLEETSFCMHLYLCSMISLRCKIEFHGQQSKLPSTNTGSELLEIGNRFQASSRRLLSQR